MSSQPPSSTLSPSGLLSLPYRLCNPPPAVGKVRSCGVTPIVDVRLEDVLARRHLPPIGLKDLEEYLLYAEHAPENLYFILWLKDYTARYRTWVQREKSSLVVKKDKMSSKTHPHKFSVPPTPDPALAMFYLRAKQTFFTPNGEYELNIPSDILAPFHCSPHTHPQDHSRSSLWHSQSIHPDPAVFSEVAMEAQGMLNESLKRFVRAASTNVGSQRAVCGIVVGCACALLSGVLPLVLTTGGWNIGPHGRLIRLVAFPGLWFGLTVFIASLQGICLMIYFFGDLRQLRKFELARPTISRPMPMPVSSPMPFRPTHLAQPLSIPPRSAPPLLEKTAGASPTVASMDSPATLVTPARPYAQFSTTTLTETSSCESCASEGSSVGCNEIDVSPAFFDDVPAPEGPATASCLHRPEYRLSPSSITYVEPAYVRSSARNAAMSTSMLPTSGAGDGHNKGYGHSPVAVDSRHRRPSVGSSSTKSPSSSGSEYGPTAGFIPSDYRSGSTPSLSDAMRSLRSQRSACYFDFDALPANRDKDRDKDRDRGGVDGAVVSGGDGADGHGVIVDPASPHLHPSALSSSPSLSGAGPSSFGRTQYKCNQCTLPPVSGTSTDDRRRHKRFSFAMLVPSFTAGVPAFAAPLTPVHSPVVKRAQWEVVIRAGTVAAVIAGTLTGIMVGVVP